MDFQRFSRPRVSSFCFPDWVSCALRRLMQTISESNQIAEYDQRQPDHRCLMAPGDRWPKDEQHHADREDDVPVRMIVSRAHRRLLIRGHRSSFLRHCVLRNRFVHNFPHDTASIRQNHPPPGSGLCQKSQMTNVSLEGRKLRTRIPQRTPLASIQCTRSGRNRHSQLSTDCRGTNLRPKRQIPGFRSNNWPSVSVIRELPFRKQHRLGRNPTVPGGRLPSVTTILTLVANSDGMKLESRESGSSASGQPACRLPSMRFAGGLLRRPG